MFSSITQRLLWKEFRAQQTVWIAIAGELVLLQLWWGIKGHEFTDLNLFSMAFVLTGVFAMSTSALLFAGESEARTDGFLRQLPITPRQLIGGKLLYAGLALTAFLLFALLSTLIAGQMAGKYGGGDSGSQMGDPSVFALSIVGLAAWGLFFSLLTRKVLWTVIGAALTEIIIGGLIHSMILAEYHLPEWVFYSIYAVIIAMVVAADTWLLTRWCTSEAAPRSTMISTMSESGQVTYAPETLLPWLGAYRWSCFTGMVSGICIMLLLLVEVNIRGRSLFSTADKLLICGGGTLVGVTSMIVVSWLRSRVSVSESPTAMRHALIGSIRWPSFHRTGEISANLFASIVLLLGCVFAYATLGFFVSLVGLLPPSLLQPGRGYMLGLAFVTSIGSGATICYGDSWLRSTQNQGYSRWLLLLQRVHAIRHRTVRRIGPLLWIECRRTLPVLVGGWVLLILIGHFRLDEPNVAALSHFAIVIAALVCGLLTILPDRTQGTLAFLTERGVSSSKILASKVCVWGGTLGLLLIPPLLLQDRVWRMFGNAVVPVLQLDTNTSFESQIVMTTISPAMHVFALLLGAFTIGVLAAAWVRRPVLAGIVGFSLMLAWFGWVTMLMDTYAPIGFPAVVPIILFGLGILWTGQRTLLEQSSWRSKCGQVGWVLLVGFIGLQGYFHFRANEVPVVADDEVMKSIRNGQPSPLGQPVSSWMYPFDESIPHAAQLDSLVHDETKRNALYQPPGLWGAPHAFQMGIASLQLDKDSCDLDAAFEHLRKWLSLSEQLAYASRDEDGWVDALYGRRVLLSAIRQWANHPQQTAERIETALGKLPGHIATSSGATVIARQYADARRTLDASLNPDSPWRSDLILPRWLLARTGEKERVRRLIDYYFYLSANTYVSQPHDFGQEFTHWISTSRASCATFGVELPWQLFSIRHRGQFELALSAESATRLTLQLQMWRLKHGSFPTSFAELIVGSGPIYVRDFLTNDTFHYEPQGFDRDLLAETHILIPARQPLLYSEGITEPRGVQLNDPQGFQNPSGIPSISLQYQARNFRSHPFSHPSNPVPSVIDRPAHPNTIRFVVLGQATDEDLLYRIDRKEPFPEAGQGGGAAAGGSGMSQGAVSAGPVPSVEPTPPEPSSPATDLP